MNRKEFLKSIAMMSIAGSVMKLNALNSMADGFSASPKMPILFLGHGNPMNAITENEFSKGFRNTAANLPKPKAIICISAHWETKGTFITAMDNPRTIHDFGGFPQELFDVQYPAKGSPETASLAKNAILSTTVGLDHSWGLDHGCWSVIKHMYPNADVPVLQMSIDYTKPPQWHYELAKELEKLREKGVLIVGSGNIVHNLGKVQWNATKPVDWVETANEKMKKLILDNNHKPLIDYKSLGKEVQMAVPTPEHYLPLLYILGLKKEKEEINLFNDKTELGGISMTSVRIG
ncbi:MAG: 4,5-DOPA dioxygenase extradiol [Bacteroidetes bacterium]|nr:4,5-DOPA dioxygenase extradiol [Bacteroidota bacterium]